MLPPLPPIKQAELPVVTPQTTIETTPEAIDATTEATTAPTQTAPPGLPNGYTLTVPDNWTRPGYRLDGPDGFWTIATSYERGVAMARLHARAARLRTTEGGTG